MKNLAFSGFFHVLGFFGSSLVRGLTASCRTIFRRCLFSTPLHCQPCHIAHSQPAFWSAPWAVTWCGALDHFLSFVLIMCPKYVIFLFFTNSSRWSFCACRLKHLFVCSFFCPRNPHGQTLCEGGCPYIISSYYIGLGYRYVYAYACMLQLDHYKIIVSIHTRYLKSIIITTKTHYADDNFKLDYLTCFV